MIAAPEFSGFLQGHNVAGLLHHAQDGGVAPVVGAQLALGVLADVEAPLAEPTLALASFMASASFKASCSDAFSRWKAMRWADLGPMPGRRPSSSMST